MSQVVNLIEFKCNINRKLNFFGHFEEIDWMNNYLKNAMMQKFKKHQNKSYLYFIGIYRHHTVVILLEVRT